MTYFKKLVGEKVYLSPVTSRDATLYCQWLNNLEVARNLVIFNKQITEEWERMILDDIQKNGGQMFAIIDRTREKLIGNCSLFRINKDHRKCEIGIFIGEPENWGKGYGTEAMKLLVDYGFNILNMHNILLEVHSFNQRAISCYKKVGFREIGRRREALFFAGRSWDEILMDIIATEFESPYINQFFPDA
ncbi:MAG: GNAT family N-acetyltransferase [Candidatus Cloacimonetes bacterium]|nr:GNAT family N-acetyltransferase [Candidatus Cloacimonadota bacterium]